MGLSQRSLIVCRIHLSGVISHVKNRRILRLETHKEICVVTAVLDIPESADSQTCQMSFPRGNLIQQTFRSFPQLNIPHESFQNREKVSIDID